MVRLLVARYPCQQYEVTSFPIEISGILPPPRLLAAARILVGLTQRELANRAGLAASSVSRYEAGQSMLRADTLRALLDVLRPYGVRFVDPDPAVEMGVIVLRREAPTKDRP